MTGAQKQVLRIVRHFEAVDAETIAEEVGMSVSYVIDLCRSLIEHKFLAGSPTKYRLTQRWSRFDLGYFARKQS